MNIITDKTKAPAKLRYRVSNNSGSINKEFGKNQQAAYYGIKEQMISMFSYRINKDKRFYTIEVFEVPSIELIELCDSYNCKLMANILNKKNEYGEFDQVVVCEVYPINLNDIEFV